MSAIDTSIGIGIAEIQPAILVSVLVKITGIAHPCFKGFGQSFKGWVNLLKILINHSKFLVKGHQHEE